MNFSFHLSLSYLSPSLSLFLSFPFPLSLTNKHSYEDISTLLEIEDELNGLEQLTIIQLGDSIAPGDLSASSSTSTSEKEKAGSDKDKKKSKSKLKSGKQTKSAKVAPVAAKKNTNTAPSSKKKALQGLLVLRPASVDYANMKMSNIVVDSSSSTDSDSTVFEVNKKAESKKDRKEKERDKSSLGVSTSLPPLIVGRSSKQNDRITFEIAKEHHLWFHVQVNASSTSFFFSFKIQSKML